MSLADRIAAVVTTHSRIIVVSLLLVTALVGAGAPMLEEDTSLDQFASESAEVQAREDIDERFAPLEDENTTKVQLIHTGDDVLTRESLIRSLEFQQEIRNTESINETLVEDDPITGIENVVAMTAIGLELETRNGALERGLEDVTELQREYEAHLAAGENEAAAETEAEIETTIEETIGDAQLDDEQAEEYVELTDRARELESQRWRIEQETETPEEDEEYRELTQELDTVYTSATYGILAGEYIQLHQRQVSIEEQIAALEDLNDQQFEALLSQTLSEEEENGDESVLAFMPSSYEPGSTEAESRMTVLTQRMPAHVDSEGQSDRTQRSQLELRDLAEEHEQEYLVFGAGIGTDELDRSLGDSLAIVGPLALLFVVVTLVVAYRDPLDIVLGVVGIIAVLIWTFGFMGWAGIAFNQVMIAVPVLLIGLSIDYAIHVFMRHREQRETQRASDEPTGSDATREQRETSSASNRAGGSEPGEKREVIETPDQTSGPKSRDQRDVWSTSEGTDESETGDLYERWTVPEGANGWQTQNRSETWTDSNEPDESSGNERREPDDSANSVRGSMRIALAGVGVALVWVTATTAIGFLANLVSPIGPIREFGITSAFGILAALLVFGALIPAIKIEVDSFLEARGFDRRKRAFGTGGGRLAGVLTTGATVARTAPVVILVATLLVTAGGAYGASQVDTSFNEEDFLAEDPPEWTEQLPEPVEPGDYQIKDDLAYINTNYERADAQTQILVEGDVTDERTLERVNEVHESAAGSDVLYTRPNGEADVQGPLSVMEETAAQNESFNESFAAADTDGNGVPDENVESLYDELFAVNEKQAKTVIHRTDGGTYEAIRLIVAVRGDADFAETTEEMRDVAGAIDVSGTADQRNSDAGHGELNAIATGDPIVNFIIEQDLFETVLRSLVITLVAVFGFLTAAYWLTGNGATLGAITMLPVAFAVSWILGTMHLLNIPFNVLTGMVTSLTIGLGVAYSIHVSSRYTLELERQGNVWSAMYTTVSGTGGALLGSAATTIGGFGTLAFAILPVLRQFGLITGITIAYSFLASVIVLPSLLVLWTRYFGPDVSFDSTAIRRRRAAVSDGGTDADITTDKRDDAGKGNE